ncbi:MAG: type I 3-dehydroquinate dehydratase, partial [Spirochaetales bacterium]|nr:type I 3-dehydroquinate dehydratase [Spirochaetales bacterium]
MICLTLMEDTIEKNFAVFMENSSFVDIIELRLDMLIDPLLVEPELVRSKFNFPVIITCRLVRDGGKYSGNEYQRRDILYQFSNAGFDYIDLEMGIVYPEVEEAAHSHNTRIIRSYHNFEGIPDNFEEIFRELAS